MCNIDCKVTRLQIINSKKGLRKNKKENTNEGELQSSHKKQRSFVCLYTLSYGMFQGIFIFFLDIKHPKSFMELLMCAPGAGGAPGGGGTPRAVELREEMLVLALAGGDTSAVAASFLCCLLAHHPRVQDRLYKE